MINKTAWNHVFNNNHNNNKKCIFLLCPTLVRKFEKKKNRENFMLDKNVFKFFNTWAFVCLCDVHDDLYFFNWWGEEYFMTKQPQQQQQQLDAVQSRMWRFVTWYKTRRVLHEYFISKLFRYRMYTTYRMQACLNDSPS